VFPQTEQLIGDIGVNNGYIRPSNPINGSDSVLTPAARSAPEPARGYVQTCKPTPLVTPPKSASNMQYDSATKHPITHAPPRPAASTAATATDAPPGKQVTPAQTKKPAAAKAAAPAAEGTATTKPVKGAPGFTAVFVIAGLLAVAYAMMRRRIEYDQNLRQNRIVVPIPLKRGSVLRERCAPAYRLP